MPTATAAQAPVPQASVSPAPRSNTRRRMASRATTCMKPALTPRAKRDVALDQRPLRRDRRGIDVGDELHRVRVAHRDHRDIDAAAFAELDRPERQPPFERRAARAR